MDAMVAMPYLLVNIVLGAISMLLLGVTSAALVVSLWLPAQPRSRRMLVFLALAVGLSVLPIVAVRLLQLSRHDYVSPQPFYDLAFSIGLVNSVVLVYRFLGRRCFRGTSKIRRRLLLGVLSVLMTMVSAFAVVEAVVALCTIR